MNNQHTANQHYTPKHRFRYFEKNRLHHEFYKDGTYIGHKGVGKSIGACLNLYEPILGEYAPNELETDVFANCIERKQKRCIDRLLSLVACRNVLQPALRFDTDFGLSLSDFDYETVVSLVNVSIFRLPEIIDIMNADGIDKKSFFQWLDLTFDNRWLISIRYIDDSSVDFLLPDCGSIRGLNVDSQQYSAIFQLSPKVCLYCIREPNGRNYMGIHNFVLFGPASVDFVNWVNDESRHECYEKYVSLNR